jgi:hypothetical protein
MASYVCTKCNAIVERPQKLRCPYGHRLATVEFWYSSTVIRAGWIAFLEAVTISLAFWLGIAFNARSVGTFDAYLLYAVLLGAISLGAWRAYSQSLTWQRQGGPVSYLVRSAQGSCLGFFFM